MGLARQNLYILAKSIQPHLYVCIARLQLLTTVYLTVSSAPYTKEPAGRKALVDYSVLC